MLELYQQLKKEDISNYKPSEGDESVDDDVSKSRGGRALDF